LDQHPRLCLQQRDLVVEVSKKDKMLLPASSYSLVHASAPVHDANGFGGSRGDDMGALVCVDPHLASPLRWRSRREGQLFFLRRHYGDGVSEVGEVGGEDRGYWVFTIRFRNGDDGPPPPSFLSVNPNEAVLSLEKRRRPVTTAALLVAFFSALVVAIYRQLPKASGSHSCTMEGGRVGYGVDIASTGVGGGMKLTLFSSLRPIRITRTKRRKRNTCIPAHLGRAKWAGLKHDEVDSA
jgi:hypothetical protein